MISYHFHLGACVFVFYISSANKKLGKYWFVSRAALGDSKNNCLIVWGNVSNPDKLCLKSSNVSSLKMSQIQRFCSSLDLFEIFQKYLILNCIIFNLKNDVFGLKILFSHWISPFFYLVKLIFIVPIWLWGGEDPAHVRMW